MTTHTPDKAPLSQDDLNQVNGGALSVNIIKNIIKDTAKEVGSNIISNVVTDVALAGIDKIIGSDDEKVGPSRVIIDSKINNRSTAMTLKSLTIGIQR